MPIPAELQSLLSELKISPPTKEHAAVETVEALVAAVPDMGCSFSKNLLIKDKKAGLYLVVVTVDRKVDMKVLAGKLGLSGANFRFADEAALKEKLGVGKGAASALAVMNDAAGDVKIVLDKELMAAAGIGCHPLRNDTTCVLTPEQLLQFLARAKHEPIIIDFEGAVVGAPGAPKPPKEAKAPKAPQEPKEGGGKKKESGGDGDQKGIQYTKEGNFSEWYQQVIVKSEMIDFYDISGCYILRPWSYMIWEAIQSFLDGKIKTLGEIGRAHV